MLFLKRLFIEPEKFIWTKPEVKPEVTGNETRNDFVAIYVGLKENVRIESLSKSRLRLKIPKRFEIPQKLILEGWRLSGMSRVFIYMRRIWRNRT